MHVGALCSQIEEIMCHSVNDFHDIFARHCHASRLPGSRIGDKVKQREGTLLTSLSAPYMQSSYTGLFSTLSVVSAPYMLLTYNPPIQVL